MIGLFIVVGIVAAYLIKIPYSIRGRAMVMAPKEYTLKRTLEGNLISTITDHVLNTIDSWDVTEFQRGDVVEFKLSRSIANKKYLQKGDTLGYIISNEEQRNLIELKGQFEVLLAELEFFTTGQKPEDVLLAKEAWDLARQELATQHKLMDRSRVLHRDGVISTQEFEIEENELLVKVLQENIAEANYLSKTTGEKPEQEKLVKAKLRAISMQIEQIETRLKRLVFTSPFDGKLLFPRGNMAEGTILRIADTSAVVGIIPVVYHEYPFVDDAARAKNGRYHGTVQSKEDVVRWIDNKQAFYVTTLWPYSEQMHLGSTIDVRLECDTINLLNFFWRRFSNNAMQQS